MLWLGHPGDLKSAHILKCMHTQTAPYLTSFAEDVKLPHDQVVHPDPSCKMLRLEIKPVLIDGDAEVLTIALQTPALFEIGKKKKNRADSDGDQSYDLRSRIGPYSDDRI